MATCGNIPNSTVLEPWQGSWGKALSPHLDQIRGGVAHSAPRHQCDGRACGQRESYKFTPRNRHLSLPDVSPTWAKCGGSRFSFY